MKNKNKNIYILFNKIKINDTSSYSINDSEQCSVKSHLQKTYSIVLGGFS